jgi:hypothetical protein
VAKAATFYGPLIAEAEASAYLRGKGKDDGKGRPRIGTDERGSQDLLWL